MTTMQNKNSTLVKDRNANNSQDPKDESGKKTYAGDLEFLNKLQPNKIAKLQSAFRNLGRGNVKADNLA